MQNILDDSIHLIFVSIEEKKRLQHLPITSLSHVRSSVIRPCESLKVIVLPETELVPLILPEESRYVVDPVDEVDAVPLTLPWASRKVVDDPEPLDVFTIRP